MEIQRGDFVGLLGPNGAGKSTLFMILSAILPRTTGEVSVFGTSLENLDFLGNTNDMPTYGFVSQSNIFWEELSVEENLALVCKFRGIRAEESTLDKILTALDFTPAMLTRLSRHLSGGNKRKLCLGMALISEPDVLLLDEVSAGLDPIARRKILDYLKGLDGTTVLLISHKADEIEQYCHKAGILC